VADLACGSGRNARPVWERGAALLALDRSREKLAVLRAAARGRRVHPLLADLESAPRIPLATGSCGAVLVFRFLFRPLVPEILRVLRSGGLLLYETFTIAQRELGWGPRHPDFLLRSGELPALFPDVERLTSWEGVTQDPRPEAVARLAARRR
jgi:SAM-dependent methyltransferase